MKTRAQLVARALKAIGVVGAGQSPEAEDFRDADEYLDPMLASLRTRSVYLLDDLDNIPDEVFLPLARLLGVTIAPEFGVIVSNRPELAGEPNVSEGELRAITAPGVTDEPIRFLSY